MTEKKVWTKEEIAHLIMTDERWTVRALLALFARQTEDEQLHEETHWNNNMGFMACDASYLSRMAKAAKQWGRLTEKQLHTVRYRRNGKPRIKVYAGQLTKIANG